MREMIGEELWPAERVEIVRREIADDRACNVSMIQPGCGAQPDDVDDRQAGARAIIAPERAARIGAVVLQAAGVGRIGSPAGMPP